ncbi:hypothetical protein EON64_08495 [archaeon]|nr:MAG: hypothetical protein EON64_08495 [archaeon]
MFFRDQMRAIGNEGGGGDGDGDLGRAELMYMAMRNEEMVGDTALTDLDGGGGEKDVEVTAAGGEAGEGNEAAEGNRRRKGGKKVVNVLDLPWTPPDIEKARKYADYVQPRKGGKGACRLYGYGYESAFVASLVFLRYCCIYLHRQTTSPPLPPPLTSPQAALSSISNAQPLVDTAAWGAWASSSICGRRDTSASLAHSDQVCLGFVWIYMLVWVRERGYVLLV